MDFKILSIITFFLFININPQKKEIISLDDPKIEQQNYLNILKNPNLTSAYGRKEIYNDINNRLIKNPKSVTVEEKTFLNSIVGEIHKDEINELQNRINNCNSSCDEKDNQVKKLNEEITMHYWVVSILIILMIFIILRHKFFLIKNKNL